MHNREKSRSLLDRPEFSRQTKPITAGLVYFLLVFVAGFALGTLRVLFLVPVLSERYAELLEMPVMLGVIYFAARFVVHRFLASGGGTSARSALLTGLFALVLLLGAEFGLVLYLRGISLRQYFNERDPIAGAAYYLSLVVFLFAPYWFRQRAD